MELLSNESCSCVMLLVTDVHQFYIFCIMHAALHYFKTSSSLGKAWLMHDLSIRLDTVFN